MNLLNKLFNKNNNVSEKGEALKKRLSECVQHEDRTTGSRDHVNPQEYMEHLAKLKSNPEEYDLETYSTEMDKYDKVMADVKYTETVTRLKDILMRK